MTPLSCAGAKVVARLAFNKIKQLQANLAELRQAVADKGSTVASLQQTISSLQEAASQRDAAVQAAEARVAEVRRVEPGRLVAADGDAAAAYSCPHKQELLHATRLSTLSPACRPRRWPPR